MQMAYRVVLVIAVSLLLAGTLAAGEKKLMHCFAFTVIDTASQADWDAFFKASDELPTKIPGLSRVWYGKLRSPMSVFNPDAESRKKLVAGAASATGDVKRVVRQWGMCMEMDSEAALKAYAAHPAHKDWEAAYGKVRQPGTTTFDVLGQ